MIPQYEDLNQLYGELKTLEKYGFTEEYPNMKAFVKRVKEIGIAFVNLEQDLGLRRIGDG